MKKTSDHDGLLTHYEFQDIEARIGEVHGERWFSYRRDWHRCCDELTISPIPLYVVIEANSYCNLRCTMCYHSMENLKPAERMDIPMALLDKLTDECRRLSVPSINLVGAGEPTLNPSIREIMQKISRTGAIDKFLITNGTKLNRDLCNTILDAGFERIYISLDAATPETYRRIRGYDLAKIEQNIHTLLDCRKERGSILPILRVSFVRQPENEHELQQFIEKWRDVVEIVDIQEKIDYTNWDNLLDIPCPEIGSRCSAPFTTLTISCNGDIYPCCTLYSKHLVLGNYNEMSLEEAWNCEKINILRRKIKEGNLPLVCRNCIART